MAGKFFSGHKKLAKGFANGTIDRTIFIFSYIKAFLLSF